MNTLAVQKRIFIICFLIIPVILLLLFVVYPATQLFLNSLTSWDGISATKEFIGFKNYREMIFNSADVWVSLKNNGIYFFVHLLFIPLELMIAIILDGKIKAKGFFKTITFLPYVVNGVAIAYAFSFFYSPYNGALNEILKAVGMEWAQQNWLSNEKIVNFSLVVISLWRFSGFHVVLFLAGLQSIPKDILEAAVIDGANAFQKYVKIIVPSIALVIDFILFQNMRGALQVFDIPFLVTQGGPGYASSTFTLYTIDTAFSYNNFGMASSMGVTLLLMIILLSWIQKGLFKKLGRG
ncbi:MAG: binding-protein-dependent transport system inner rane component [Eubacterium sp.]|jgi:multiple sugar transport system permease protein|nr:binding-protein-dependent transport system inner rane component [Eubacterium sp.]